MAILNSTFGPGLFGTGMRTADFRDQGFQNLPGFGGGINLPINIDNNPFSNPIQDGMFRPPMQQPVQNQMPVANSFLEQLQQSTQSLNNQIRNVVPQNRFVGNQFQMPFNFGGGYGYSPSNFTYTPGAFNQYGNIPVTGMLPPAISTTPTQEREGREGDRGAFGNQNNVSTEFVGNRGYRIGPDGQVEQLDPESIDYQLNKLVFDALNIAKVNPLNPLGYIDSMSQRLDPNVMRQIQAFESANPQSLTFAPGVAQAVQNVFGTPEGPLGGLTQTDLQKLTGATPPGLLNRPVQLNIDPLDLSLPTTPNIASLIEATQNLQTGNGGGYSPSPGTTGPGGTVGSGSQPQGPFGIGDKGKDKDKTGPQGGGGSGQSGPDAAGAKGSSFCFAPDTLIQMADGSEKEIQNIKLGDNTKGGKVELVVQTLGHNVYNYKGVEVSGSHWVVEDGEYIEVETSKHAQPIDDKEMLYCLNTSDHAIWVKEIQFSDFIGFGLDYSVPGVHKFWESIKDRHTESIN